MQIQINRTFPLFYIITILPFLGISGLKDYLGNNQMMAWKIASIVFLALIFNMKTHDFVLDKFVVTLIIYQCLAFFITTIYRGFSFGILFVLGFSIIITLVIQCDGDRVVQAINYIMIVAACINLVLMIVRPVAEDQNDFLGGKNQLSIYLVPAIFLMLIDRLNVNKKIGIIQYLYILICVASVYLGGSGTGMLVIALTLIFIVFSQFIKAKKPVIIILLTLNSVLILANRFLLQKQWWINITSFMGKTTNLTGRTDIWEMALQNIQRHWLFGNGKGVEMYLTTTYGITYTYTEAHNLILEILLSTGIIGLAIYLTYLYEAVKDLDLSDKKQNYIFLATVIYFINGLSESICNVSFFAIMLAIAHYYSTNNRQKTSLT